MLAGQAAAGWDVKTQQQDSPELLWQSLERAQRQRSTKSRNMRSEGPNKSCITNITQLNITYIS